MRRTSMIKLLEEVTGKIILLESSIQYKKLVKIFHPDKGGDVEIFKAITEAEHNNDIKTLDYILDNSNDIDKISKFLQIKGYMKSKDSLDKYDNEDNRDDKDNNEEDTKEENEEDKIEDEREGASEEYKKALENQYALIQIYQGCIDTIINKRDSLELSKIEKREVVKLLDEWENELEEYYDKDFPTLTDREEIKSYLELVKDIRLEISSLRANIRNQKKTNKNIIKRLVRKTWTTFENILKAELPKGIIQMIAYSNPLTALIAENSDIFTRKNKK